MIRAEYWRRHVTEVHKTQEDILLTKDGFQSLRTPWLAIFEFEIYGSWSIQR